MKALKIIRTILLCWVYSLHFLCALSLWLCGQSGNNMLGILLIVCYRLSLWSSPLAVTLICWIPPKPMTTWRKKLLFYFVHLALCACLFLVCRLLFGNWF